MSSKYLLFLHFLVLFAEVHAEHLMQEPVLSVIKSRLVSEAFPSTAPVVVRISETTNDSDLSFLATAAVLEMAPLKQWSFRETFNCDISAVDPPESIESTSILSESPPIFIDLREQSSLMQQKANITFGKCQWVFVHSTNNLKMIQELKPHYQSKVFTISYDSNLLTLWEHYFISKSSDVTTHKVEVWEGENIAYKNNFIWERRSNLHLLQFKVAIIDYPPHTMMPDKSKPADATGFNVDFLMELQNAFNFTYNLVTPEDGAFGRADENGNYNGIMGMVQRREIDFSAQIMKVTLERAKASTFTQVVSIHSNVYATLNMGGEVRGSFLSLFDFSIWLTVIAFLLSVIIMAIFYTKVYGSSLTNHLQKDFPLLSISYFAAFVSQGSEDIIPFPSLKVLKFTALILGFFVVQMISARMASNLSVERIIPRIGHFEDIKDKGLNLYVLGGSAILDTFALANPGSLERILYEDQIKTDPKFTAPKPLELLHNMLDDPSGVIVYNPTSLAYWVSDNKEIGCKMETLPRTIKIRLAYPVQLNFPFIDAFNYHVKKLHQSGIIENLKTKWLRPVEKSKDYVCSAVEETELQGVQFGSVTSNFMLLGAGILLGCLAFLAEKVKGWEQQRKEQQLQEISSWTSSFTD